MDNKEYNEALQRAKELHEALQRAKELHEAGNALTKKQMEIVFPQLAESEDERIRKDIVAAVEMRGDLTQGRKSEIYAYLEKQKEPENTSASTMVPSCWEVEQKEQKPVQSEVEREYVRTLKSLISDFLRGKEEVDREYYQQIFDWLDGRHIEQKPVDFPTTDEEVNEFLETHSKVEVPEKYKTPDFVFSKQEYKSYPIISKDTTSVKPAEWSEEDENIRKALIWHLKADVDFVSNGVTKAECIAYLDKQKAQKQEWSDEDKRILKGIIGLVDHNQHYNVSNKEMLAWLKSLRNRVGKEFLQPHWKPSEEQMRALKIARSFVVDDFMETPTVSETLKELEEQLKKL